MHKNQHLLNLQVHITTQVPVLTGMQHVKNRKLCLKQYLVYHQLQMLKVLLAQTTSEQAPSPVMLLTQTINFLWADKWNLLLMSCGPRGKRMKLQLLLQQWKRFITVLKNSFHWPSIHHSQNFPRCEGRKHTISSSRPFFRLFFQLHSTWVPWSHVNTFW